MNGFNCKGSIDMVKVYDTSITLISQIIDHIVKNNIKDIIESELAKYGSGESFNILIGDIFISSSLKNQREHVISIYKILKMVESSIDIKYSHLFNKLSKLILLLIKREIELTSINGGKIITDNLVYDIWLKSCPSDYRNVVMTDNDQQFRKKVISDITTYTNKNAIDDMYSIQKEHIEICKPDIITTINLKEMNRVNDCLWYCMGICNGGNCNCKKYLSVNEEGNKIKTEYEEAIEKAIVPVRESFKKRYFDDKIEEGK